MTISSQKGEVSVALQPGKVGRRGTFDSSAIDYYKMRAVQVSFGTVDDVQLFPLEIGDLPVFSGAYKQGVASAGTMQLIPRLKEIFGILLLGSLGAVSSASDVNSLEEAVTGMWTHTFRYASNKGFVPWLSARAMIPGQITAENSGETGIDVKVASLRFSIPGRGKLGVSVNLLGRDIEYSDASSWTYSNATHENDLSTPDAGRGEFKIGGIEYAGLGAEIELFNQLSTPDVEQVMGDFRMDDIIVISRGARIRFVEKYASDDLCRRIYTNGPDAVAWSSLPFYTENVGAEKAFEAYFQSPGNISGTSPLSPYGLRFRGSRVVWQKDQMTVLQGTNIVTASYVGTVLSPDSGEYIEVLLENASAGALYAIPDVFTLDMGTSLAYASGDTVLDSSVTLTYTGMSVWRDGKVALQWGIPSAGSLSDDDSFSILTSGNFSLSAGVLSHSATPVGTVTGGTYGENLAVRFNSAATDAIVEELLESLRYGRVGDSDSTTEFDATLIIQDSAGNTITHTITISHS